MREALEDMSHALQELLSAVRLTDRHTEMHETRFRVWQDLIDAAIAIRDGREGLLMPDPALIDGTFHHRQDMWTQGSRFPVTLAAATRDPLWT
jgi:hypothetical protein